MPWGSNKTFTEKNEIDDEYYPDGQVCSENTLCMGLLLPLRIKGGIWFRSYFRGYYKLHSRDALSCSMYLISSVSAEKPLLLVSLGALPAKHHNLERYPTETEKSFGSIFVKCMITGKTVYLLIDGVL